MEIKIFDDKNTWNSWLLSQSANISLAQSWEWGNVLIAEGKKVERLAVVEDDEILAEAQIVYSPIFFGWQYVFCPKGPVIKNSKFQIPNSKIYEQFSEYLKNRGCIFFRVEPEDNIQYPISNIQIKKTIDINPSATLILDLTKTETELLAAMHPKTRYNIHLAEKKNLQIRNEKNLEVFWQLMNKTGNRDKFGLHSKKHYEQVLCSPIIFQKTVYTADIPVACAVFAHFGNTFTYLYGASDHAYRSLMAPYLLQWEGTKMGKSFGCAYYDFFGVAPRCHSEPPKGDKLREESLKPDERDPSVLPQDDSYQYDVKHQYAGVTRFKLGFGGKPLQTSGTFDVMIDKKKYFLYGLLRKVRRLF